MAPSRPVPPSKRHLTAVPTAADDARAESDARASAQGSSPGVGQGGTIDSATLNRAKLGDAAAFTRIVETYYARSLRFARAMLRNPDEAEDMVQETFVRVFRALPRYEERQRFESWLFHILANCCRTANKGFRRHDVDSLDDNDLWQRLPSDHRTDAALDHEFGDEVRQALAELPDYNREVFLLHYIEEFSYEEIERITGIKRSALKMRVKRASDYLRARLSRARADAGGAA
jgi:RNA polymerase sigma-70 factor (ECF subfamily)